MNKHLQILKKNRLRRRKGSKQTPAPVNDGFSTGFKVATSFAVPLATFMHINHQRNIGNYNDRLLQFIDANGRSMIREGALAVGLYGATYLFVDNVLPKLADGLQ